MISEHARFVPFKNVLREKFIDGTEMLLAEGKDKFYDDPEGAGGGQGGRGGSREAHRGGREVLQDSRGGGNRRGGGTHGVNVSSRNNINMAIP
ncbi:hypothetical protein Tco_0979424, partial [Tanacetum coccineum]